MYMKIEKYSYDTFKMYEEECDKNKLLTKEINNLKLEISNLKYELDYSEKSYNNKLQKELEKNMKPLIEENEQLKYNLQNAYNEITRLKKELESKNDIENDKDYKIDKLTCQINKDSFNSSIPTSKEIINKKKNKTGANIYNHREKGSSRQSGGQIGHKGATLTKKSFEEKIKGKDIETIEIKHYIQGNNEEPIVKYKVGIKMCPFVEKHIFISDQNSNEKLPKEFYSDVSYHESLKTLVIVLGSYCSLAYNKIKELICDLTSGLLDISEGTIDNIYEEFSDKTLGTLNNIITNIKNGTYQHTDETTTKENGKDTYYRAYANPYNVIYKYHHHKGDVPITEDNILVNYYGTVISDHDKGIFKYGTNNQDCIIHLGRYFKEQDQNINNVTWQMKLYYSLLRFEKNRKILSKFDRTEFTKEEIELMEKEYDDILELAEEENKEIESIYWKEKANTLLKRLKKYKDLVLFYIHDFSVPYDNNFIECALRMIKGKTKVSGGFRSEDGAIRFGNIMSIIKTAKLRGLNPFNCIKEIYMGKELFA